MEDGRIWKELDKALGNSNCLKTNTAAAVVKNDEIVSLGYNLCSPEGYGYGDKLLDCPRMKTKTGTDYGLCSPVHAEVMACLNVRTGRSMSEIGKYAGHLDLDESAVLSAFTEDELGILDGSTLYLMGHYWACGNCLKFLNTVGINDVKFDDISSEKTKKKYLDKGLDS